MTGTKITLPRTGDAPVTFEGELVAEQPARFTDDRQRHHKLAVYRTRDGSLVLHIHYQTDWKGEEPDDVVGVWQGPRAAHDLAQYLRDYDPTCRVAGYPPGPGFREKQERLLFDIAHRYEAQVGRLLASRPDLFGEEVK